MDAMLQIASKYAIDHSTEAAARLERVSPGDVASFLARVDPTTAARVLDCMVPSIAALVIDEMEESFASEILSLSTVQRIVRVLRPLDLTTRDQILGLLPEALAAQAGRILRFPEGSVGSIADTSVEALPADMLVGDAIRAARDTRVPYLYVVNRDQTLVGVVHKRDLYSSDEKVALEMFMLPNVTRIPASATVVELQRHRAWRDLDALPVVDRNGVYLGVIRHKTLREIKAPRPTTSGPTTPLDTFVDLAELYWVGLSTMVAALAEEPAPKSGMGGRHER
jgi:magnesium transporter